MAGAMAKTWQEVKALTWQQLKAGYLWGDIGGMLVGMQDSQVTVGSASATGAIFVAPKGTAFPTNASSAIPSQYQLLGFTSDAGVRIADSANNTFIHAWEDRTEVMALRTEYSEEVSFMPIQCVEDVAKLMWGEDMVEIAANGDITSKHHGKDIEPVNIIIETIPRDDIIKRFCGTFQLVERGEQVMDGTQVDSRALTFHAVPNVDGITLFEYTAYRVTMNGQEQVLPGKLKSAKKPLEAAPNAGGMYSRFLEPNFIDSSTVVWPEEPAVWDTEALAYLAEIWPSVYGEPKTEKGEDGEEIIVMPEHVPAKWTKKQLEYLAAIWPAVYGPQPDQEGLVLEPEQTK